MKNTIAALATCAALIPAAAFANAEAIAAAKNAGICDVTNASYLASGQLSVQCRPGTVSPEYQSLIRTSGGAPAGLTAGLTTGTAVAIGGGLLLVAVLLSDDDDETTTTTTTTTN